MNPTLLGKKYDKIAEWWNDHHLNGEYGVEQTKNALKFCETKGKALDVGCGSGGRIINLLGENGFSVTGIDVSTEMINLASKNHPSETFIQQDICIWEGTEKYNFIIAWDSLFHLPIEKQEPVLTKLCNLLEPNGILFYTFGDAEGEHTDQWHDSDFYYSSIGINKNINLLIENGLKILHLELDQHPQSHVYIIAKKS